MKKTVYIMQGVPGTGKSTFIRDNDLEDNTLSFDAIRVQMYGRRMDINGKPTMHQGAGDVFEKFYEMYEKRLLTGNTTIIDITATTQRSSVTIAKMARDYGFEVVMVKPDIKSLEYYQMVNAKRQPEKKKIPHHEIERKYNELINYNYDSMDRVINWDEARAELNSNYRDLAVDLNEYKKIHHFGDIHGQIEPLREYFQRHPIQDDEFYVFTGDYIDRGDGCREVMDFVIENIKKPNFIFLYGNHEVHLNRKMRDIKNPEVGTAEFRDNTWKQIQNMSPKALRHAVNNMGRIFIYKKDNKYVINTHGGISNPNLNLKLNNVEDYYKGVGGYSDDIDTVFTNIADHDTYQIHGHRNFKKELANVNEGRSWSLESDVEFGGHLSVMVLENGEFKLEAIRTMNKELEKVRDRNFEVYKQMRLQDGIREKETESNPNVVSLNFKRGFEEWDDISIRARGMFFNKETGEVVARGYDKFFNINESGIPGAQEESLAETMVAPITAYHKYNGYLGLVGYDSDKNELFFASKSTDGSDHAEYLKMITEETVGDKMSLLKSYLRGKNKCMAFEVIEPDFDPHIIKYDKPKIVLLDVFERSMDLDILPYRELKKVGDSFNMEVKDVYAVFNEYEDFIKFKDAVLTDDPLNSKKPIEGIVAEDANKNYIKVKFPFYNTWKYLRNNLNYVASRIEKDKQQALKVDNLRQRFEAKFPKELADYSMKLIEGAINTGDTTELRKDIIKFREGFNRDRVENRPTKRIKNRP